MAKLIIGFDEIGGIKEYTGLRIDITEPLIINKAADYLTDNMWAEIDDENYINYKLTFVDWGNRVVNFHIQMK